MARIAHLADAPDGVANGRQDERRGAHGGTLACEVEQEAGGEAGGTAGHAAGEIGHRRDREDRQVEAPPEDPDLAEGRELQDHGSREQQPDPDEGAGGDDHGEKTSGSAAARCCATPSFVKTCTMSIR